MRIVERYSRGMRIYLAREGWSLLVPLRFVLSLGHGFLLRLSPAPCPARRSGAGGPGPSVISVGNLVAGGAGKTPCVLAIASELKRRGRSPAVICSGYGGTARDAGRPVVAVPAGPGGRHVGVLGDEAALYLDEGLPVVVCRDRARAIETACGELGPTHIILDDAFHRTELEKDLDILLLDHRRPFGNGRLLPGGELREPPSAARRADAIVFTRACGSSVPAEAAPHLGAAPVFFARHLPAGLTGRDGRPVDVSSVSGRPVVLFSGIARHDSFEDLAREAGLDPAVSVRFDDHHRYRADDADLIVSQEGAGAVFVTTGKDWEKALRAMPSSVEILRLGMRMEIEGIERLLAPVI
ncbi:MAG: tetraacyldisaccharide 4'-kinase [Candidatus Krumholzibacteria bacterium]|nr:tetraacyldisaccharide 4'-kinase [Candidatus Krumholzibacteria bacterium]